MATQRHLANAPLREALIDIQHTTKLPINFAERLASLSIPGLQRKQQLRAGKFEIRIGNPTEAFTKEDELIGWRFDSVDGSQVAQVRRNGISFSVLHHYKDWPEIKNSTRHVWDLYLKEVETPVTVNRVAARYINVLELPPNAEINEYLTAGPKAPPDVPQRLENFLQRVIVPYPNDTRAIIIQALESGGDAGTKVILDIDVFTQRVVHEQSMDLWTLADTLRGIKNTIFFSSVTEQALERYA